jgi:1-acyl-sn-glycerol-3-phosphate acyltransferase
MRGLGGIPVNRADPGPLVADMAARVASGDRFALLITPEGTRARREVWKSGFYRIALGAGVPVVPGYLDFARKRAGLGPAIHLSGDVGRDMDALRAFYAHKSPTAYDPSKFGPIRLREESETRPI